MGPLAAVLVAFTLPTVNCDGSTLTDLDSLWVRYQPSGSVARVASSESVRGKEGSPWSTWVAAPPDTLTAVWADLSDIAGNRSCAGTVLWLQPTVGVPQDQPRREQVFDVAGRLVQRPLPRGWYVVRSAEGARVEVVK